MSTNQAHKKNRFKFRMTFEPFGWNGWQPPTVGSGTKKVNGQGRKAIKELKHTQYNSAGHIAADESLESRATNINMAQYIRPSAQYSCTLNCCCWCCCCCTLKQWKYDISPWIFYGCRSWSWYVTAAAAVAAACCFWLIFLFEAIPKHIVGIPTTQKNRFRFA